MAPPRTRDRNVIKRLPADARELIGRSRDEGLTIDEILEKLKAGGFKVSRSTLARWTKQLDAIGQEIQRSRAVAEALVSKLGDQPSSRIARLNIELLHSLVMKLLVGDDGNPVELDPREAMFAAQAVQKLALASKQESDLELKMRKEIAAKLDGAVKEAARAGEPGLTAERVAQLRRDFLGVSA